MVVLDFFDVYLVSGTRVVRGATIQRGDAPPKTLAPYFRPFPTYDFLASHSSTDDKRVASEYVEVNLGDSFRIEFQINQGFVFEGCKCLFFDVFVDGRRRGGVIAHQASVLNIFAKDDAWATNWPYKDTGPLPLRRTFRKVTRPTEPPHINEIRVEVRPFDPGTEVVQEGRHYTGTYIGSKRLAVMTFYCTTPEIIQRAYEVQQALTAGHITPEQRRRILFNSIAGEIVYEDPPRQLAEAHSYPQAPSTSRTASSPGCTSANLFHRGHGTPLSVSADTEAGTTDVSSTSRRQTAGKKRRRTDHSPRAPSEHPQSESGLARSDCADHRRLRSRGPLRNSSDSLSRDSNVEDEADDRVVPIQDTPPSPTNRKAYEAALREARAGKRRATSNDTEQHIAAEDDMDVGRASEGADSQGIQESCPEVEFTDNPVQERSPPTTPPMPCPNVDNNSTSVHSPDLDSTGPESVASHSTRSDCTVIKPEYEDDAGSHAGSARARDIIAGYIRDQEEDISRGLAALRRQLKEPDGLNDVQRLSRQDRVQLLDVSAREFLVLVNTPVRNASNNGAEVEEKRKRRQKTIKQSLDLFVADMEENEADCLWQRDTLQNIRELKGTLHNWIKIDADNRATSALLSNGTGRSSV